MRVSERSRQNTQRDQRMSDNRKPQTDQIPAPAGLGPGVIISPDTLAENRLPPRQVRTRKWPVLDAFGPAEGKNILDNSKSSIFLPCGDRLGRMGVRSYRSCRVAGLLHLGGI